ncbi:hypothetical protein ES705_36152 [subsurface metagenome]
MGRGPGKGVSGNPKGKPNSIPMKRKSILFYSVIIGLIIFGFITIRPWFWLSAWCFIWYRVLRLWIELGEVVEIEEKNEQTDAIRFLQDPVRRPPLGL